MAASSWIKYKVNWSAVRTITHMLSDPGLCIGKGTSGKVY